MNKYGRAAVDAVVIIKDGHLSDPIAAWEKAMQTIFSKGTASQKKRCPRNTFLGLCEDGMINGVK